MSDNRVNRSRKFARALKVAMQSAQCSPCAIQEGDEIMSNHSFNWKVTHETMPSLVLGLFLTERDAHNFADSFSDSHAYIVRPIGITWVELV